MVTALDVAQAIGYALLVAGFTLWVVLSSGAVNGGRSRRRRTLMTGSRSPRGTCGTRPPRRRP